MKIPICDAAWPKKKKNQNTKTKWWPWGAGWELDFLYTEQLSVLLAYVHYVAQIVKNPPAMQETQVQSLGGEDPLEKEMATTQVFLPGEFHGQRNLTGFMESQRVEHN